MKDPFLKRTPFSLLLICMTSLTDIIHTLPAYAALRKKHPNTRFSWLVDKQHQYLLEDFENLETIPIDIQTICNKLKTLEDFWQGVGMLKALIILLWHKKFTGAILFEPCFKSSILAFFAGARIRLGFSRFAKGGWFFTNSHVKVSKKLHMIEQNLSLISAMGIDSKAVRVEIPLSDKDHQIGNDFLADVKLSDGDFVLFSPASSKPGKQWTVNGYADLADKIKNELGLTPVIIQNGKEEKLAKTIIGTMKEKSLLAPELNLKEFLALAKKSAFLVAPDTSQLHLAAMNKVPVIGLYGSTDPKIVGTYWENSRLVRCQDAQTLSPKNIAKAKKPVKSMRELKVEDAFAACYDLYESSKAVEGKEQFTSLAT